MIRKFKERGLTEIGGSGGFTWWRYRDSGNSTDEMFEPGFFNFFQHRAAPQARIKEDDLFLLHGSNGLQDAIVTEIGPAPNFAPKLMPMGKPFVVTPAATAKKAA